MLDPSNFPGIPEPTQDPASLQATLQRVKESVEILTGQRGAPEDSLVITINDLIKASSNAHASIKENFQTFLTDTYAMSQHTLALESSFNTAISQANARITTEETTRASADSALASRTTTLEASYTNLNTTATNLTARITTEETVRANADSALATRTTTLEANYTAAAGSFPSVAARITNEETVRATAVSGLATRATTLEANVNFLSGADVQINARISNEETVRFNADNALSSRTTTLEASYFNAAGNYPSVAARISAEEQARASQDSALASQLTTLSTTVGDNTADINTLVNSVNGLSVQWAVTGFVGGTFGGLVFTGIRRADGLGGTYSFDIYANVHIYGDLIVDGSVTYRELAANSATQAAFATGSGSASITMTTRSSSVVVELFRSGDGYPTTLSSVNNATPTFIYAGDLQLYYQGAFFTSVPLNSNTFYTYSNFFAASGGAVSYLVTHYLIRLDTTLFWQFSLAAGTYTFQGYCAEGGTIYLRVTEYLR